MYDRPYKYYKIIELQAQLSLLLELSALYSVGRQIQFTQIYLGIWSAKATQIPIWGNPQIQVSIWAILGQVSGYPDTYHVVSTYLYLVPNRQLRLSIYRQNDY